jgi:hypothetical protein
LRYKAIASQRRWGVSERGGGIAVLGNDELINQRWHDLPVRQRDETARFSGRGRMSYRFNILSASTSSSIFRNCSNHQLGSTSHVIALSVIVLHPAMRELMRKCCEGGGDPPIRSLSRESRCVASTHIEGRIDRGGRLVVTASVICSVPSLGDEFDDRPADRPFVHASQRSVGNPAGNPVRNPGASHKWETHIRGPFTPR